MQYNPKYPLKHLSIRVPWHDNKWNGTVCKNAKNNDSCLVLKGCALKRNDEEEMENAGMFFHELVKANKNLPPCLTERAAFMADFPSTKILSHPYANNDVYKHFAPTPATFPAYSAPCIPFRWMLPESAREKASLYNLNFREEREPFEKYGDPKLEFTKNWVQDNTNQRSLLEGFFSHLKVDVSLCFFYAKDVPFVESSGRVLVGVGVIKNITDTKEYKYSGEGDFKANLWEHMVSHSIRPEEKNGFLLPYHEALEYQKKHEDFDPEELAVVVPAENKVEFSYASEHVEIETARKILLLSIKKLKRAKELGIGKDWDFKIKWLHDRISEIEELRSDYPGLGAVLCALGLEQGHFIAQDIFNKIGPKECPWKYLDLVFSNPPKYLSPYCANTITDIETRLWHFFKKKEQRFKVIQLLSRFNLTIRQAKNWFDEESRKLHYGIVSDQELLDNPYILFEKSVRSIEEDRIGLDKIDIGMMLNRSSNLLPYSKDFSPNDPRRIRAFTTHVLEKAANEGHALLHQGEVVKRINQEPYDPECTVNGNLLEFASQEFHPKIIVHHTQDKKPAYQLNRLNEASKLIHEKITKRLEGQRHSIKADWDDLMRTIIDSSNSPAKWDDTSNQAKEEKIAALEELANSRFSILIGPAGSGKTTLLAALSSVPEINDKHVLMLAPTGKARVRMEVYAREQNVTVKTIAGFLFKTGRFRGKTQTFHLNDSSPVTGYKTVIIDECSMLTEEMLAANLQNIKGVERLILVGDPRQLPPIGAGRPFVDIINFIKKKDIEYKFPRIGKSYVELTQSNRQIGQNRLDLEFANLFSGTIPKNVDEIFSKVLNNTSPNIKVVPWESETDFESKLLDVLSEELGINDYKSFNKSFESIEATGESKKTNASSIETWQILSAVKSRSFGSNAINRVIHEKFKGGLVNKANRKWNKGLRPLGNQEIVWSDKVINLQNKTRDGFPKDGINYLANGEIGWVKNTNNNFLNVEFSSQKGYTYGFTKSDFKEEGESLLELAYSLTIHKAQGSDFNVVILVIPDPCLLLNRELLYTALTRQKEKAVLMYQGNPISLYDQMGDFYSDTYTRITNLFYKPNVTEVKNKFFERNLIHCASDGTMLRSKSELIIYETLKNNGLEPVYEYKLAINGKIKRPDFTIIDDDLGRNFYWEHLGMLSNAGYKRKWEEKKRWYKENDILTDEEGHGKRGTLIITQDDHLQGISVQKINALVRRHFKKSPVGDTPLMLKELVDFERDLRALIFGIKEQLHKLANELVQIKESNQETDKKINAIYLKLDEEEIGQDDLEKYRNIVKSKFSNAHLLEQTSFDFLVSGCFIKQKLEDLQPTDYSMFILQYCRAIERELLQKVFLSFYSDLAEMKEDERDTLLENEFGHKQSSVFAKMLYKERKDFTLGIMGTILSFIWKPEGNTLASSNIFQRFRVHVINQTNEQFLSKDRIKELKEVTTLRNKSAHVEPIPRDSIENFENNCNSYLNGFLEAIGVT